MATFALALVLRLHRVADHGVWYDEAYSLALAQMDLPHMVAATALDFHPPLYYALLAPWVRLAGTTEFALRFPSVAAGVLASALLLALGRRAGSTWLGLSASLLAAASPFLVYYSQEARMYTISASLMVAAAFFSLRAIALEPTRRWLPGYVLTVGLATYTHLFSLLALPAFNLAYFLLAAPALARARHSSVGGRWLRPARVWILAQLAVALLFLPWALVLYGSDWASRVPVPTLALPDMVRMAGDLAIVFAVGLAPTARIHDWLSTASWLVVLNAIVLAWWVSRRRRDGDERLAQVALFAGLWLVVSFAVAVLLLSGRHDYAPRYLIVALPAFLLLLALSVVLLARVNPALGATGALILLAVTCLPLGEYYGDTSASRPDHRAAIRTLQALAQPGDVVVLEPSYNRMVFDYYNTSGLPYLALPETFPPRRLDTERSLAQFSGGHERLWVLLWQAEPWDPDAVVSNWLERNLVQHFDHVFNGEVQLKGYENRPSGEVVFNSAIRLERFELVPSPPRPGEDLRVRLYWRCLAPVSTDYHVFVHLVDDGYTFFGQHDGPPDQGRRPTSTWTASGLVMEDHVFRVDERASGRDLVLRVGLYDLSTGSRLPTAVGDNLALGRFRPEGP